MKLCVFRLCVASVGVLFNAALPVYGAESVLPSVADRAHRPLSDDVRLPDHLPVQSPGFPSELTGKCLTMQACLAYCNSRPAEPACHGLQGESVDKVR